jgi:hypothetical protein
MTTLVLFASGNPSIPKIYNDFFKQLELKNSKLKVHEIPFYTVANSLEEAYLENLFEMNARKVQHIINEGHFKQVYLVGHSIGCTFILSQYEKLKDIVDKSILIHPFIKPVGSNYLFLKIIENRILNNILLYFLFVVSFIKPLFSFFNRCYLKNNSKVDLVVKGMSTKGFLALLFKVTSNYISYYKGQNLFKVAQAIPEGKVHYIFSPKDFWCPKNQWVDYPQKSKQIIEVNHDFCLWPEQCEIMAKTLVVSLV